MNNFEDGLRPEEFAEAADAAIHDALSRDSTEGIGILAAAGLLGVCASEVDGGLGLDLKFAVPLAQAAGRLRMRFALVEQLLLAKYLRSTPFATSLVNGSKLASINWSGQLEDGWVGQARLNHDVSWLLVKNKHGSVLLDIQSAQKKIEGTLDPDNPQIWVDLNSCAVLAELDADLTSALWVDGAVLMAATVHGAAEGALNAAVAHTSNRVQFDRPLSARQAVRHLLSRMKLYHEVGGAAISRALQKNENNGHRGPLPALMLNLEYATFIVEKAIHLHGGMGFTWEVPLHHALREIRKIDADWGALALPQLVGQLFIQNCES